MRLPPSSRVREDCSRLLEAHSVDPDATILDAFETHLGLLARWNERYNLTAIRSWEEILSRHLEESLRPLPWVPDKGSLLDVGSGNGFPALPILWCRAGLDAILVERSERKAIFLRRVLKEVGRSNVEVFEGDFERFLSSRRGSFEVALSRATLSPFSFLSAAAEAVAPGGRIIAYARAELERDLDSSRLALRMEAKERLEGRRDSWLLVFTRI